MIKQGMSQIREAYFISFRGKINQKNMEEKENKMKQKKTGISAEKQEQWILQGKYVILAVLVGICVGIVDTIFGRGLLAISDFREQYYRYLIPILPVAGLAIVWMYQRFSSLSLKGMTLVFEVGQKKREEIPLALVPLVMIGTWITHLFGGSAGREGVAVQIGATLSHETGRRLHIKETKPVMLITGMAAGFGGLFQTPLAAVFFAMEVGVSGYVEYDGAASGTDRVLYSIHDITSAGTGKIRGGCTGNLADWKYKKCSYSGNSRSGVRADRAVFFCTFAEDEEAGRRQNQQSTGANRMPCHSSCCDIAGITWCEIQRTRN